MKVLSPLIPLFAQLMHTNYNKIVKQLKSFKITIATPTCFGLHKPSSGSYSICFAKVTMLTSVTYRHLKLSGKICNRSQHCNFSEAHSVAP